MENADDLRALAQELAPDMTALRRDLHCHPETAFTEYRTAALLVRRLEALGWHVVMGADAQRPEARLWAPDAATCARERERAVAQGADAALVRRMADGLTGLWAEMRFPDNGTDGPLVALRFDMDALEIQEASGPEHRPAREGFASCHRGSMHACGHDGHVALGVGLAALLARIRHRLRGRVRLLFQPAEEIGGGAGPMIAAGALDGVDWLIGLHLGMQAGETGGIACGTDCFLATTTFTMQFDGRPAHAGMTPHEGRNALLAGATAVQSMQAVTRHSGGASRVNIGQFHSGDATNIIAGSAWLAGETRGETTEVNAFMMAEVERMAQAAASMWGCSCLLTRTGECPSAASSPRLTGMVEAEARDMGLFRQIAYTAHFQASEDFAWLMNKVQEQGGQAVYVQLGADRPSGHHTDHFDFDERALPLGLELLARLTSRCLGSGAGGR
ncbi:MAG: amidohydrolase [Desulfovibrionaceae bacterium]|nr:amidohydrolase [Desulfovibrionaceae bacterium]